MSFSPLQRLSQHEALHHVMGGLGKVEYFDDCYDPWELGNFTLNLIKAKRQGRERAREEISSGREKTDQTRLRRHRFRWLEQCRLVYLGFIDFLITPNAS